MDIDQSRLAFYLRNEISDELCRIILWEMSFFSGKMPKVITIYLMLDFWCILLAKVMRIGRCWWKIIGTWSKKNDNSQKNIPNHSSYNRSLTTDRASLLWPMPTNIRNINREGACYWEDLKDRRSLYALLLLHFLTMEGLSVIVRRF